MTVAERTILAEIANLDPARGEPLTSPDQADETLRWVLAHDRTEPDTAITHHPHRRRAALVGAAAAVVVGVFAATVLPGVISGAPTRAAATVPMLIYAEPEGVDARAALERLAVKARASAPEADGSGRYRYLREESEEWIFPEDYGQTGPPRRLSRGTERWIAPDGSLRELVTRNGMVDGGYQDWTRPAGPPLDVSGTPEEFLRRVARGEPIDQIGKSLLYAYDSTVGHHGQLPAAERAAYLEALATTDVVSYGAVTDRAGRPGIAFGVTEHYEYTPPDPEMADKFGSTPDLDGSTMDFRVILDPETGELLGTEHIETGNDHLPLDTVTGHTTFLEDTYVDALPECGAIYCSLHEVTPWPDLGGPGLAGPGVDLALLDREQAVTDLLHAPGSVADLDVDPASTRYVTSTEGRLYRAGLAHVDDPAADPSTKDQVCLILEPVDPGDTRAAACGPVERFRADGIELTYQGDRVLLVPDTHDLPGPGWARLSPNLYLKESGADHAEADR